MKKKALLGLSLVLMVFFLIPTSVVSKEIKTLSQFPLSGPVGSLPEFGWGFIDGMNWVKEEVLTAKKSSGFWKICDTVPKLKWPTSASTLQNMIAANF